MIIFGRKVKSKELGRDFDKVFKESTYRDRDIMIHTDWKLNSGYTKN